MHQPTPTETPIRDVCTSDEFSVLLVNGLYNSSYRWIYRDDLLVETGMLHYLQEDIALRSVSVELLLICRLLIPYDEDRTLWW
jgi:hypothetical protein